MEQFTYCNAKIDCDYGQAFALIFIYSMHKASLPFERTTAIFIVSTSTDDLLLPCTGFRESTALMTKVP